MQQGMVIRIAHGDATQGAAIAQLLGFLGHRPIVSACDGALGGLRQSPDVDCCLADVACLRVDGRIDADEILIAMVGADEDAPTAAEITRWGLAATLSMPARVEAVERALAHVDVIRRQQRTAQRGTEVLRDEVAQARREYEFLSGRLSHDVQGLLQNIERFAAAMQTRAADRLDSKDQHFLERIKANALKGNALVNDLLQYYRLATCPLELQTISVPALLHRARQRAGSETTSPAFEFVSKTIPGQVKGDPALLEHVLHTLLSNAAKFLGAAADPRIEVISRCSDAMCEITVRDNGIGFDPAEAHRLFQPFGRLHPTEQFAGNGMSLAIARRIVERHGGSVRAVNNADAGASFSVVLPTGDTGEPAVDGGSDHPDGSASNTRRVLLVDDDPLVLTTLSGMLERLGYRVTTALDGEQALASFEQALTSAPFDVVVTDWGMPHVGGQGVAQAVKRMSPSTAVAVLTGLAPDAMREELGDVDVVLTKPVRLAQLRGLFDSLIHPRR